MSHHGLDLTRERIVARRLRVNGLHERLPRTPEALRLAAWAGLQDSVPRAALLSIHARLTGTDSLQRWHHVHTRGVQRGR